MPMAGLGRRLLAACFKAGETQPTPKPSPRPAAAPAPHLVAEAVPVRVPVAPPAAPILVATEVVLVPPPAADDAARRASSGDKATPLAASASCRNGCGWTAFGGHATCCRICKGPAGPHAKDCSEKNQKVQAPCDRGCGRPSFASFSSCCTRCKGADGPHTRDCAIKCGLELAPAEPSAKPAKPEPKDVEEDLRSKLAEWHAAGAMKGPSEVDEVVEGLAADSSLPPQVVRVMWLSVARQARAVCGPGAVYVDLAKQHHGVDVEVVDLGQYSVTHSNSCMFLTCAVALADRKLGGHADASIPCLLGESLDAALVGREDLKLQDLISEHLRDRSSALGQMADALRHAACEVLFHNEELYFPFFHPVGEDGRMSSPEDYRRWVQKMRGDEEGDELVILALASLCGMAVQPVQQSGYRVPLMDPTESAESGFISYWGNDDRHWVWLRPR